jgi:hypothetical protein
MMASTPGNGCGPCAGLAGLDEAYVRSRDHTPRGDITKMRQNPGQIIQGGGESVAATEAADELRIPTPDSIAVQPSKNSRSI